MLVDGHVTDRLDVLLENGLICQVRDIEVGWVYNCFHNPNVFLAIPLREQVRPIMLLIKEEVQKIFRK